MKIKNNLFLCFFVNVFSAVFITISTDLYYFLIGIIINTFVLVRTKWSRIVVSIYCYLILVLTSLSLVYSLFKLDSLKRPLWLFFSLILGIAASVYYIFILNTKRSKIYFQPVIYLDPDIPEGWICPQCKSKMLFSLKCWNCGYKKDDLLKTGNNQSALLENNQKIRQ